MTGRLAAPFQPAPQARRQLDQLMSALYPRLLALADRVRRGHGGPGDHAALVADCYLRLATRSQLNLLGERHLLALAARTMRQILLNNRRHWHSLKRGGGADAPLSDWPDLAGDRSDLGQLRDLDRGLNELLRQHPRLAAVVDCRVFAGMTEQETACCLGLSLRSSQRLWRHARSLLHDRLCQQVPCRHGRPPVRSALAPGTPGD